MKLVLIQVILCLLVHTLHWPALANGEACPSLPVQNSMNQTLPYSLNVRRNSSTIKSEFICDFVWTDLDHLKEKLLNRLTARQKTFVRFTVPVLGYNNPYLSMANYSGLLTWVWVLDSHEYMLYYPHNFIAISMKTMGIITFDWAFLHTNNAVSGNLHVDQFDTKNFVGNCDPQCIKVNKSCGIGKYELEKFLLNVTKGKDKFKWSSLCLQAPYHLQDIVSVPQFALPDLLYYWRFIKMFCFARPWFGIMQSKTDLPHYYCYDKNDNCEIKELLSHYWVIPFIGFLLWFYCPLLVHYFPSSVPKRSQAPSGMFPSYKTPIYFGRCLKWIFCFYLQKGLPHTAKWICFRRTIFFIALVATSYRLLCVTPYSYCALPLFFSAGIASLLVPTYLSEHIFTNLPTHFMHWDLPKGLVRSNNNLTEYQHLAHVMQERIYLTFDIRFWKFILESSHKSSEALVPNYLKFSVITFPIFIIIFAIAFLVNLVYFFVPLLYFIKVLLQAICMGEYRYLQRQQNRSFYCLKAICAGFHGFIMAGLLGYTLCAILIWCYAISEFTMFTFVGGTITASMAFQYFVLVGYVIAAIYGLVRSLHEIYDRILEEIIKIFETKELFTKLAGELQSKSGNSIVQDQNGSELCILIKIDGQTVPHCKAFIHDGLSKFLRKDLYDNVIEKCQPLRRQIAFVVLKIIAIFFYGGIAFWVKNTFHLEDKVGVIFQMVNTVVIYFIPSLLQFISYKSNFGKNTNIILRKEIYNSLIEYLSEINNN